MVQAPQQTVTNPTGNSCMDQFNNVTFGQPDSKLDSQGNVDNDCDDLYRGADPSESFDEQLHYGATLEELWLCQEELGFQEQPTGQNLMCNNIPVCKIQNIAVFVENKIAQLSLDSGCEGDCIREDECVRLGLPVQPLDKTDT